MQDQGEKGARLFTEIRQMLDEVSHLVRVRGADLEWLLDAT